MNQVPVNRPQNIEHPQLPPPQGGSAIISKGVTVVANFFRTSGPWLVETSSWFKDRVIDLFPEQVAMHLDPRRIFIRTVLDVAPDQRAAVLQNALPCISPQMDQNTIEQLIQLVNDENPSSPLSRSMLPFITPDMYSPYSIATTAAIQLITPEMNAYQKGTIIERMDSIAADQRANFVQYALKFIHPEMDAGDRYWIIEHIVADIAADQRANFLQNVLQLMTPEMDAKNRYRIIIEVPRIAANQRANIIQHALELMTPEMNAEDRCTIISGVADVAADQRANVIQHALELITPQINAEDRCMMIGRLAYIAIDERANVIQHASQRISPEMDTNDKCKIIERVAAEITTDQKANVIQHALQLMTPEMNAKNRYRIIRCVADIAADQRANVIQHALELIHPEMDAEDRCTIIRCVVADIAADQRANVIQHALELITPQINAEDRCTIIRCVADIAADQRADVIQHALELIYPQMNAHDRCSIIQYVADIAADQRANFIQRVFELMTPEMNARNRFMIIFHLAHIAADQRTNEILQHVLEFITPEMDAEDRCTIIGLVANIAADQRANVIQHALELITPQMNAYDRYRIIERLTNMPADRRGDYVQHVQANALQNAHAAPEQGIDVHEGDRDQKVKLAIELLWQRQGEISTDRMNRAVNEFTQYLNGCKMNAEHKQLAKRALLVPNDPDELYGPLISATDFSILGLMISGQELIGRLWMFALELEEPEQTNVKESMIAALQDSYFMGFRVCNQGKTQRLIVGVLQGRFQGVDIELTREMNVSTTEAVEMFFNIERHRNINQLAPLLEAANRFCDENAAVNRDQFVFEIRNYAQAQGLDL